MLENGYVTLPRLFFRDWEWSDDANTVAVFVRLLIEADIVPNSWHGIPVPRGGISEMMLQPQTSNDIAYRTLGGEKRC